MADVAPVFLALAALTLAGFIAGRIFERTRFPDIPLLLALGLLVGPVNRWAAGHGFGSRDLAAALDPAKLHDAAPYIAGLALVVLLFDSGMQLDFTAFRRSLGPATLHTFPIFLLTVVALTAVGHYLLGMPFLVAAALAIALVNVDQSVSAGILKRMRIGDDMRSIYFVEMALYDLLSIPILVALIKVAGGLDAGFSMGEALRSFAAMASVSFAVGLAGGIFWLYALRRLHHHPNSYMLTFAMTLAVYGVSQVLGGSGALSILLFGLLVGNRTALLRRFGRIRDVDAEHEKVQLFHDEITFFVRTLFFLFLGISFRLGADARWPAGSPLPTWLGGDVLAFIAALLLLGAILLARYVPVRLSTISDGRRSALFPVFGRGLDTAVLVTLPFLAAGYVPGTKYYALFSPWEAVVTNLALLTILLTVLASSLLVFVRERALGPAPPPAHETVVRPRKA
ncbi:MAG: potassium/hydrogen antiporter [Thermoplasmata archaeon]|jgi:cell volume regulation protein A|nr:potassium/hydrogen antiporter [Thermoplasmata archaeon]